jgi:hypothetical protein
MTDFVPFPKIPRLNREIVITEKIDGTNAAINITYDQGGFPIVVAQSRKRIITPSDDNHGFAKWVDQNRWELAETLGEGLHFGEWWGQGVQRGYGLTEKRFSLFNVSRWTPETIGHLVPCLRAVPILYEGPFTTGAVDHQLDLLSEFGSVASPGFMDPEGVVVFHTASNSLFKATVKDDEKPKGRAA